jgi:hypothetical protein
MSLVEDYANLNTLLDRNVLNADISVRAIVAAAQRIPGVGGPNPLGWELVTNDFVYKGLTGESAALTEEVVQSLQEANILNWDLSLRDVVDVSSGLPRVGGTNPVGWELVTTDFVLRGLQGPESRQLPLSTIPS